MTDSNAAETAEVVQKDLFALLKSARHIFEGKAVGELLKLVDRERTLAIAERLGQYIEKNLPEAVERRNGLADYRTNPYVLLTAATVMRLGDPEKFAAFLFNSKLYMALETSFGKSVESALVGHYPSDNELKWADPDEKVAEFAALKESKVGRQERAVQRTTSVWREIDKAVIHNSRRFLVTIKSGPNTINDTQVQGMTQAIIDNHAAWLESSLAQGVEGIDVVVGLTYGTPKTTNNKDNQILAKLTRYGFSERDRAEMPGVLTDETGRVRIYRVVGSDFWSFIGDPTTRNQPQIYLEILLALSQALARGIPQAKIEERLAERMGRLAVALAKLTFPRDSLPDWIKETLTEEQLFWFATALTAFFDEGI
jgi:hypothetical protein